MIKLVKGNIDYLEGKVVAYAKLKKGVMRFIPQTSESEPEFGSQPEFNSKEDSNFPVSNLVSYYGSTDILEVIEKINPGIGNKEEIIANLERIIKESMPLPSGVRPLAVSMAHYESEEKLLKESSDIVYAGDWENPIGCIQAANVGIQIYSNRFLEQLSSRSELIQTDKPKLRVLDIQEGKLGVSIERDYIGKILDAARRQESLHLVQLRKELIHASQKTPFYHDVVKMCSLINTTSPTNIKLVEAYIGKIKAIESQDFEEAARYRDHIRNAESK